MITFTKVEEILKQHGIENVHDNSSGSKLADDLGIRPEYSEQEIKDWLGY
jgi:hypothetical protein